MAASGSKPKKASSVKIFRHTSNRPALLSTQSHLSRHVHLNRVKERVRKQVAQIVASAPVAPDDQFPEDCPPDSEEMWVDDPEPVQFAIPKKRTRVCS